MSAFYLMVPVSVLLAAGFLILFLKLNDWGHFDDTTSPSVRMLDDKTLSDQGSKQNAAPTSKTGSSAPHDETTKNQ
jgi:cbb3-type cytochrome oxidase maturation protein